jgi:hypothetical protein
VHLDEAVLVRLLGDGAVEDDEDVVVVVVDLRALAELLRVLDRERMEPEDVAQDPVVARVRLVDVEPEEGVAGEQTLDVLAVEAQLLAAAVVDDGAGVRRRPFRRLGDRASIARAQDGAAIAERVPSAPPAASR